MVPHESAPMVGLPLHVELVEGSVKAPKNGPSLAVNFRLTMPSVSAISDSYSFFVMVIVPIVIRCLPFALSLVQLAKLLSESGEKLHCWRDLEDSVRGMWPAGTALRTVALDCCAAVSTWRGAGEQRRT